MILRYALKYDNAFRHCERMNEVNSRGNLCLCLLTYRLLKKLRFACFLKKLRFACFATQVFRLARNDEKCRSIKNI